MIPPSSSQASPQWIPQGSYEDILFDLSDEGLARITINRPHKRNAFRPKTVIELFDAFSRVRDNPAIGVVLFTGAGPAADGGYAFCAGGDQSVRGDGGYVGDDGLPRLNVLDLQRLIRSLPKVVIALVAGYAIGGGQVLHLLCDLSLAAENAVFGQTGPRVGSFDGGFGASYLARLVGQRKAREIWFLCRQYNAQQALSMGLVNAVVPLEQLEQEGVAWAGKCWPTAPRRSAASRRPSMPKPMAWQASRSWLARPPISSIERKRARKDATRFCRNGTLIFRPPPGFPS